jgi:hypothetical protein
VADVGGAVPWLLRRRVGDVDARAAALSQRCHWNENESRRSMCRCRRSALHRRSRCRRRRLHLAAGASPPGLRRSWRTSQPTAVGVDRGHDHAQPLVASAAGVYDWPVSDAVAVAPGGRAPATGTGARSGCSTTCRSSPSASGRHAVLAPVIVGGAVLSGAAGERSRPAGRRARSARAAPRWVSRDAGFATCSFPSTSRNYGGSSRSGPGNRCKAVVTESLRHATVALLSGRAGNARA